MERLVKGRRLPAVVLALALASATAWAGESKPPAPDPKAKGAQEPLVQAQPPPFSEGIYPCSTCHDSLEKNATRRELSFHDEQQSVFSHDEKNRWCLDCHDLKNRDVLHLANGAPVPFTESYRLCGQCHGDKLRDWRVGVHGKRVGKWDGEKTYFLCVNCHNPHTPRFKGVEQITVDGKVTVAPTLTFIKPEPRPHRPEEMRP